MPPGFQDLRSSRPGRCTSSPVSARYRKCTGSVTNLSFSLLEGLDTGQVSPYKGTLSARFHMDGVGIMPLVGDLGDWQFDGMCSLGVAWSHRETRPVLAVRV